MLAFLLCGLPWHAGEWMSLFPFVPFLCLCAATAFRRKR